MREEGEEREYHECVGELVSQLKEKGETFLEEESIDEVIHL